MADIQDYAIIGNGRSAALVSRSGSIDWLCWPRFDSPSLFGRLLDTEIGGSWQIAPSSSFQVERQYIEDTNVLQTRFQTEKGSAVLTDFMTAFSEAEKNKELQPEHELVRYLECIQGEIEIEILFNPRPQYGRFKGDIQDFGFLGLRVEIGHQLIALHSPVRFYLSPSDGAKAFVYLKAGETMGFSLTYTQEGPAVIPLIDQTSIEDRLKRTAAWWQTWARKAKYHGPYRKQVMRSALVLKLLGFAPSGAYVAAATASLPERIGGDLNWDYRYCWLRDASFTVRSLLGLGYLEEVEAFISWMLHSTRLTLPELKAVYDVYGEKMMEETDLPHLKGFANSRPVRIGIAIREQLQLDVYGEVIDGIAYYIENGGKLDREGQKMVRHIGKYVCKNWNRKDNGIWEERGDLEYYTYSHLMCWVALDKLLQIPNECALSKSDIQEFEKQRALIRKAIETKAWNAEMEAYTSYLNGKLMDACVLLMPSFSFEKASSQRMQKTYEKIQERLIVAPGLIYRYEKSYDQEGAFLICSFWHIDFLLRGGGTLEDAQKEFEKILKYANDLDLFSEEIDPKTSHFLGNFPQAFTHIGLINAALLLEDRRQS